MSNTYHAKFQVFMSMGSAINWATIFYFNWPPLQKLIQIWSGTTEKIGAGGEVTSSKQDSKNKVTSLVGKLKLKLKLKLRSDLLSSDKKVNPHWLCVFL